MPPLGSARARNESQWPGRLPDKSDDRATDERKIVVPNHRSTTARSPEDQIAAITLEFDVEHVLALVAERCEHITEARRQMRRVHEIDRVLIAHDILTGRVVHDATLAAEAADELARRDEHPCRCYNDEADPPSEPAVERYLDESANHPRPTS